MPYYHVRIKQRSVGADEVKLDFTIEELEERVLVPYRKGRPITIGGKSITTDDIERIRITMTEQASAYLRPVVQQERDSSVMISTSLDFDIAAKGDDMTDGFIAAPPGSELEPAPLANTESRPPTDAREVFVVHGRNLVARDAFFAFLRSIALQPLEWSEAVRTTGTASPYIGEVLAAAFSRAHAVVVLFTPDDEARLKESFRTANDLLHETQLTGQARANVLFEAGMAMGRNPDRTVLVELGSLRPFSDVGGRHVIRIDNSSQRRQELAQRLQTAGCPVNLGGTAWHTAGDFEGAITQSIQKTTESAVRVEPQSAVVEPVPLSEEAHELLIEAIRDNQNMGMILMTGTMGRLTIRANGKNFVQNNDRRSEARWKQALNDLLGQELVEDSNGKGTVFGVTDKGYRIADGLAGS